MHQQVLHIQRNSTWYTERIINPCIPHRPFIFTQLPLGARQSNVFPALGNRNLISIGQLCDHGFSAIFTAKDVSLIGPNTTLTGTQNTNNGLYYMDLQSIETLPVAHIP